MNSIKEFFLPVLSHFYGPACFSKHSAPPSTQDPASNLLATLQTHKAYWSNELILSQRLIRSIDPALLGNDRAHDSKDSFFRLLCNVYYGTRRLFISRGFVNSLMERRQSQIKILIGINRRINSLLPPAAAKPVSAPTLAGESEEMHTPHTAREPALREPHLILPSPSPVAGPGSLITDPAPMMMGMPS